ncbi:MAG TPA: Gfo/Idh/MocA family oxidoreductase [Tepidisphaeraceae bacterium]|nr:Gfo/Idh/MocA family oxidoreductase [Tepidisphaeraceae bacterium]
MTDSTIVSALKRTIRVAVIGAGKISEEHLRFLSGRKEIELAAICDLSEALGKFTAERFSVGAAFSDYRRMLDELRPQVVHVLTPAHTHMKIVADCLEAGAHVIVEKPIAPTHREFLQLWRIAEQNNRRLIEDHNYRFNDQVLTLERMVAQKRLGTVQEVEVRLSLPIRSPGGRYADENLPHPSHKMPAGVLHEFVTHLAYLALRFMPGFERVRAAWSNLGGGDLFKFDDLDAIVIGGGVHARLRFSCHTGPDCFSLIVRGSRGWVETDLFHPFMRITEPRKVGQQLSPLANQISNGFEMIRSSIRGFSNKVLQRGPLHGLHRFLEKTYHALERNVEPPVTFEDMDSASRLVDALLEPANRL